MGTSVRKMYDAELLQLDTMLARMGHAAGGAIEIKFTCDIHFTAARQR